MAGNNFVSPYYFAAPHPGYGQLNYNWPIQSIRGVQDNRNVSVPQVAVSQSLLQPPSSKSRPVSVHPTLTTAKAEQRPQSYHVNSSPQGAYRNRRYSNASGQYGDAQYATLPDHYQSGGQYPSQYSSNTVLYPNAQNYRRNFYGKRKPLEQDPDALKKANKKKKKPLSQNIPQRKDWSVQDAKRALTIEKEYNKRHRSQSLIIKFPDIELNRDIVSNFHSSIDSVHFQQPSTPRFCFVTLKESNDPESVIKTLNKIPFGQGFLTAEFKKDREDEITIGPEDIDPLTLYVGNLAQEITKDDMVNTYPKQKRIDIGYAKKMKYTRYAFVSFKNVEDSIEAFKKTHATQMYSKSLIVRFRRLNGTVGMPGEPKPQLPQRNEPGEIHRTHKNSNSDNHSSDLENDTGPRPWEIDVSRWETEPDRRIDLLPVKEEPHEDSDFEDEELPQLSQLSARLRPQDMDLQYPPPQKQAVPNIKREKNYDDYMPKREAYPTSNYGRAGNMNEKYDNKEYVMAKIKREESALSRRIDYTSDKQKEDMISRRFDYRSEKYPEDLISRRFDYRSDKDQEDLISRKLDYRSDKQQQPEAMSRLSMDIMRERCQLAALYKSFGTRQEPVAKEIIAKKPALYHRREKPDQVHEITANESSAPKEIKKEPVDEAAITQPIKSLVEQLNGTIEVEVKTEPGEKDYQSDEDMSESEDEDDLGKILNNVLEKQQKKRRKFKA